MASAARHSAGIAGAGDGDRAARPRRDAASVARRARRRRRSSTASPRGVVRAGGLGIIASILAILVFIIAQVLPLLGGAGRDHRASMPLPGGAGAGGGGRRVRHARRGARSERHGARACASPTARSSPSRSLPPSGARRRWWRRRCRPATNCSPARPPTGDVAADAGAAGASSFEGQQRVVTPALGSAGGARGRSRAASRCRCTPRPWRRPAPPPPRSSPTAAWWWCGRRGEENEFTGEVTRGAGTVHARGRRATLTQLVFDRQQRNLFGADTAATCCWWPLGADRDRRAAGRPGGPGGHGAEPAARRPLAGRRPGRRRAQHLVRGAAGRRPPRG